MNKDEFSVDLKQKSNFTDNDLKNSFSKDEKSFFLIFNNSPHPIFLIDKEGIVEDLNIDAINLLKFDRNKIKGKPFTELLESDSKKLFNNEFPILSKKLKAKRKLNLIFKDKEMQVGLPREEVIDLYKEKIWVEFTICKGTTFYFTLPKQQVDYA